MENLSGEQMVICQKKEYKSIEVKIRGKQVSIPKSAYGDLYESYLYTEFNSVYYDKTMIFSI